MLELKNINKRFGKNIALNNLSMNVPKESIFGFVGVNGAGKTTTMKILASLIKADSGSINIDGENILNKAFGIRDKIGYMPDFFGVYDDLKVKEYMDFYEGAYYIPYREREDLTNRLLDMVRLLGKEEVYVDSLSRGMKQRLCLARCLINNPQIIILDEPSSGLDPIARVEIREILLDLKNKGKTIIISSHILPELSQSCSHIGIIKEGSLVTQGSVTEILNLVNNEREFSLRVLDNPIGVKEEIGLNPSVLNIIVNRLEIRFKFKGNEKEVAMLLKSLIEKDFPIIGFTELKKGLEEIFIEVTEGSEKND